MLPENQPYPFWQLLSGGRSLFLSCPISTIQVSVGIFTATGCIRLRMNAETRPESDYHLNQCLQYGCFVCCDLIMASLIKRLLEGIHALPHANVSYSEGVTMEWPRRIF